MNDPSELSAEQITAWEARAAAGEKPVLPGWWSNSNPEQCAGFGSDMVRVYRRYRGLDLGFYLCFGLSFEPFFAKGNFQTVTAAQLAAEDLLADLVAPVIAKRMGHGVVVGPTGIVYADVGIRIKEQTQ
jgi:hypothetical protein